MREILFRGKRLCNGKWMHGSLLHYEDGDRYICCGKFRPNHYRVNPETVGQFTGLTDKNGKKIFGGDVIQVGGDVYLCYWVDGNCEWGIRNKKESMGIAYVLSPCLEVIGNIHDNPELLEVSDGKL